MVIMVNAKMFKMDPLEIVVKIIKNAIFCNMATITQGGHPSFINTESEY